MVFRNLARISLALAVIIGLNQIEIQNDRLFVNRFKNMSYKEAIKIIKTPEQAEKYLTEFLTYATDSANYNLSDYMASFKEIHKRRADDCDGGVISAAALLSDNGYEPLFLRMSRQNINAVGGISHAVFLYSKMDYGVL